VVDNGNDGEAFAKEDDDDIQVANRHCGDADGFATAPVMGVRVFELFFFLFKD